MSHTTLSFHSSILYNRFDAPLPSSMLTPHSEMSSTPHLNVDVRRLCPTLSLIVRVLRPHPYAAGWLLGSVSGVAYSIITICMRPQSFAALQEQLDILKSDVYHYFRRGEPPNDPGVWALAIFLDLDSFIELVRYIKEMWYIARLSHPAVPSTNWLDTEGHIRDVEQAFDNAVLCDVATHFFDDHDEPDDVGAFLRGCYQGRPGRYGSFDVFQDLVSSARSYDQIEAHDPIAAAYSSLFANHVGQMSQFLVSSTYSSPFENPIGQMSHFPVSAASIPAMQYEPHETSTRMIAYDGPISPRHFSIPYTGWHVPVGECAFCLESFQDQDRGALVVARCTARHVFHSMCLGNWVNHAGMENSNRCPLDREILCAPRRVRDL